MGTSCKSNVTRRTFCNIGRELRTGRRLRRVGRLRQPARTGSTTRDLPPPHPVTARDADVIKTCGGMSTGVGVLDSMAVESGIDDDLVAIHASGLFPRLTTWIGFDDDLPLKPSHRAFIQLLAPHLSDRQIDGRPDSAEVEPDAAGLPLRDGPMPLLEIRGC